MTVKEVMKIGCEGMSADQREAEQERRIKVCEKINLLGIKIDTCKLALFVLKDEKGSQRYRKAVAKKRHFVKALEKIKAAESIWRREAAWFIY